MGFAEPWQLLLYLSDLPRLEGQVFFAKKIYIPRKYTGHQVKTL